MCALCQQVWGALEATNVGVEQGRFLMKSRRKQKESYKKRQNQKPQFISPLLKQPGLALLSSVTEQVRMCACALEHNAVYFCFIDQEPIGFNMAFSSSLPVADQLVVPMNRKWGQTLNC